MATAVSGERSFYLDLYSDECVPCDCTLEGWAAWLADAEDDWDHDVPSDGEVFYGTAIRWLDDIVATFEGEGWSLSREPDGDFCAVRFGAGIGWDAESIVSPDRAGIFEYLGEGSPVIGGQEYLAVGITEDGWRFTYRAGPPASIDAERRQ